MEKKRVALVTGANKGIGFFIVKKLCERLPKDLWVVILGSRSVENGQVGCVWLGPCAAGLLSSVGGREVRLTRSSAVTDTFPIEWWIFSLMKRTSAGAS